MHNSLSQVDPFMGCVNKIIHFNQGVKEAKCSLVVLLCVSRQRLSRLLTSLICIVTFVASEGIVTPGFTLSRCVCVRRIIIGGEGNALYPVLSSIICYLLIHLRLLI